MDNARKIGIAIVMMIPAFVGAGALWDLIHSWVAVFVWVLAMAAVAVSIIKGGFQPGSSRGGSQGQRPSPAYAGKGH
jgi:hypothetical protein